MEKRAPFVIQERTVGLQVVFAPDIGRAVFLFQFHDFSKKIEAEKGRLASLPGENYLP